MMNKIFSYGSLLLCIAVLIIGCSDTKEDKAPTQTVVSVHGTGFADPASSGFHAEYIRAKNYDIQTCKSCHGSDYSGGIADQSCNTCHSKPGGPENCTTCHGSVNAAPPKDLSDNVSPTSRAVGAHQKHIMGGLLGAPVACRECHAVPSQLVSAGHLDSTPYADIHFDTTSLFYRSNASYDASNVSCNNTYCHGNFNGGNQNVTMTWTDTNSTVIACGTCHGDVTKTGKEKIFPKTGHTAAPVTSDCATCHRAVINSALAIINPARHMNGGID